MWEFFTNKDVQMMLGFSFFLVMCVWLPIAYAVQPRKPPKTQRQWLEEKLERLMKGK